jgi:hypothetical protein
MRVALVALLFVVGCGGKVLEDVQEQPEITPEPLVAQPNPFHAGDDWRGTYTCNQGLTQLDFRVVAAHDDVIDDAIFDFDWSGGVKGTFHMKGTFDARTGATALTPTTDIEPHTSNWVTVSMSGKAETTTFSGKIAGYRCTTFSVTKV